MLKYCIDKIKLLAFNKSLPAQGLLYYLSSLIKSVFLYAKSYSISSRVDI